MAQSSFSGQTAREQGYITGYIRILQDITSLLFEYVSQFYLIHKNQFISIYIYIYRCQPTICRRFERCCKILPIFNVIYFIVYVNTIDLNFDFPVIKSYKNIPSKCPHFRVWSGFAMLGG